MEHYKITARRSLLTDVATVAYMRDIAEDYEAAYKWADIEVVLMGDQEVVEWINDILNGSELQWVEHMDEKFHICLF